MAKALNPTTQLVTSVRRPAPRDPKEEGGALVCSAASFFPMMFALRASARGSADAGRRLLQDAQVILARPEGFSFSSALAAR